MCNSYCVEVDHVFETHKSLASILLLLSYVKADSTVGFEEFTCVTEHLMMALAISGMLQTHPSTDMFICPTPKMLSQVCGLEPPGGVLFISLLPDGACIPCMDDPCLHSLWMWQLLN